jgi:hypothetical protein
LLVRVFASVDVPSLLRAFAHAGRLAPLALVPFLIGTSLDALGLGVLLSALGSRISFARLLPIRIATEALHLTAPAGFVVADTATAALLDAHCRVSLAKGAVLAVARKWLVMRAHAAYIGLGALAGAGVLTAVSERFLGGRWLAVAAGAAALLPLTLSLVLGAGFNGRPAVARAHAALERLPWAFARGFIARWKGGATTADAHLAKLGAEHGATWLATGCFFGCWLFEAIETVLVLWLVGGPASLPLALAVEVGLSLVRSIGNVAPAGLGLQEAGYATLLTAMGVNVDTAAAFVLLKRGKELVWVGVGYALLAAMRRPEAAREVSRRVLAKA